MDLKYYMNIITNLSIIITFLYSIILIIDELYNITVFSFKYTYSYNYGSFMADFNNIQTIECETNRYNIYNKNNYLHKDIFSKSYFNYLIIIVITIITILFALAYGINFYITFIDNQPDVCNFHSSTSFIKTVLKCVCNNCHEFLPNCPGNYFIAFIILIIIPLSYLFKTFLKFDITPISTSSFYSFGYIILFVILLFSYSFILFNIDKTDNNTTERIKEVLIYILFTIIFIISNYIYKYIYNKYTSITLNNTNNDEIFYDTYKQEAPIKPNPVQIPKYKGQELLTSFKYNSKDESNEYKEKKEIVDNYYLAIKNYNDDMQKYTQKYNNYINTNFKFPSKINFIHIITNILGLNNYLNISIIILLIIISIIYYYKNNDILFLCIIYLICILTIITIINAIQYYNTIVNKYIIYEPLANYKNDITNANTRLNLLLDPSNGTEFYNILTNSQKQTTSKEINNEVSSETLISSIKNLTEFNNFTSSNLSNIDNKSSNLTIPISNNIIPVDNYNIYYSITNITIENAGLKTNIYSKINDISNIISINNIDELLEYNYRPIKEIKLIYNDNSKYVYIGNLDLYNRYIYYDSILFIKILEKLRLLYSSSSKIIDKYINLFIKIKTAYINYTNGDDNTFIGAINSDISAITSLNDALHLNGKINQSFFDIIHNYIKKNILTININLLNDIETLITAAETAPSDAAKNFFTKININGNKLDLSNNDTYGISRIAAEKYNYSIFSITETNISILKSTFTINTNINNDYLYKTFNISQHYIKVPSKIIDNYNREYLLTLNTSSGLKIIFTENIDTNKIKLLSIFYKNIIKFNIDTTNNKIYNQDGSSTTTIISPYIVESINENSNIDNFKKIILSSLINNLIHITTKYENSNLKSKLTTNTTNAIVRHNYSTFFHIIDFNSIIYNTNNFINSDNKYSAYIVLLYNIYTYDKNRIIDIIEYFIYNKGEYSEIYTDSNADKYLNTDILKIKTQIDKNIDKTPLILLYESNKYILNLILKLYDNLIKFIKKEIETKVDTGLCSSTSASIGEIEYKIYNHINTYFTTIPSLNTFTTSKIESKFNDTNITEMGNIIKNYFNICVFLLNNIDAKGQIEETNKDLIISNFKFYNINGETINLEPSNIDNVRKELIIKCDYYNKYNSFNKKDKINMKYNADNVGYNFPILMIIFLIILSEIGFIKS